MNVSQTVSAGRKSTLAQIVPVMLCFFAMGFVDLVGTASNYVQKDLGLTDSQANMFPSLVFFWFLIFSVPTGMLMNRIGRKKTVLISLLITALSLMLPMTGDGYVTMLLSFSLLGIGNAVMQTSLNPLVTNLINGDKLSPGSDLFNQKVSNDLHACCSLGGSALLPLALFWGPRIAQILAE